MFPGFKLNRAKEVTLTIKWLSLQCEAIWRPKSVDVPLVTENKDRLNRGKFMDIEQVKGENFKEDVYLEESVEIWDVTQPKTETVEPSEWEPLIDPCEVKVFQPVVCSHV